LHSWHGRLGPRTGPRLTAVITGCQLQNVTVRGVFDMPGLWQAGYVVDLDYPPFSSIV